MAVVKRVKKHTLNARLHNVNIDIVENGYVVHVGFAYDTTKNEVRHDEREFVFDTWGDVYDFLKKVNELVITFKVTKYAY
jgi:hypothetical protein